MKSADLYHLGLKLVPDAVVAHTVDIAKEVYKRNAVVPDVAQERVDAELVLDAVIEAVPRLILDVLLLRDVVVLVVVRNAAEVLLLLVSVPDVIPVEVVRKVFQRDVKELATALPRKVERNVKLEDVDVLDLKDLRDLNIKPPEDLKFFY